MQSWPSDSGICVRNSHAFTDWKMLEIMFEYVVIPWNRWLWSWTLDMEVLAGIANTMTWFIRFSFRLLCFAMKMQNTNHQFHVQRYLHFVHMFTDKMQTNFSSTRILRCICHVHNRFGVHCWRQCLYVSAEHSNRINDCYDLLCPQVHTTMAMTFPTDLAECCCWNVHVQRT